MSASQNNLSLIVNQQDSNGVKIVNRLVGAISYDGVAGEFHNGILTTTSITTLDLPTATILQFYIKNTHATATILITATVQGGTSVISARIGPGGVYAVWNPATGTTIGFTEIKLTASVANTTFEMFLGG